jgi:hypothetical protein
MYNMYRNMSRRSVIPTSKLILWFLALVSLVASAVYWWGVQSTLIPGNTVVAMAFTAIIVLAPPALMSFLIPWSPGGMLLQKVNAKTWGYAVVIACSIYLIYYSYQIQWSWWAAQKIVADSGLVMQQVLIGMIGFIIVPALLWTPVSSDELVEQVRQAHLVKRYELQTQADIAILRATLLRAQEKALIGFANLTVDEREELAAVMRSLVGGIDSTLKEIGHTVKNVSGVTMPFDGMLDDNEDIRDVLEYISESLTGSTLATREDSSGNGGLESELDQDPRESHHRPRHRQAPMITFKHPRTGDTIVAEVVETDSFGNVTVKGPKGPAKVRKEWIIPGE